MSSPQGLYVREGVMLKPDRDKKVWWNVHLHVISKAARRKHMLLSDSAERFNVATEK